MRAATPKADPSVRPAEALPDAEESAGATVHHPFAVADRSSSAGPRHARFRPLQPDAAWSGTAANDDRPARRQRLPPLLLPALVIALDLLAIAGAGLAADALTGATGARHAGPIALIGALVLACGAWSGAYAHGALFRLRTQLRRLGAAAGMAVLATLAAAAAFGARDQLEPTWLAAALPLGALALAAGRAVVAHLLRHETGAQAARRAVIVGGGPQATRLVALLRGRRDGLDLLGLVEEGGARGQGLPDDLPLLGGMAALGAMIRRGEVDLVVLALPWSEEARIAALVERIAAYPVEIRLAPDLAATRLAGGPRMAPLLLRARPISGLGGALKTAEDYLLAALVLAVAAVPMLLIALAVKLDSPGPVLFRQRRIGFNDRPFDVLKFRTMYHDAADHEARVQVLHGDPRVTRVGAILRRSSLDELPQVFNVLRGEMSFIGPRPHAPGTRAGNRRFDEVVANYAARHRVKPGLTGLAQVRGWRGPTPTEEQILRRVESDLEYIDGWSPWLDLVILVRTLLVVVRMRNAL